MHTHSAVRHARTAGLLAVLLFQTPSSAEAAHPLITPKSTSLLRQSQDPIPNTERGKIVRLWLDAFNSGDEAKYKAFLEQYATKEGSTLEQRLERYRSVSKDLGVLKIKTAREDADGIYLEGETGTGSYMTATVNVTSKAPYQFAGLQLTIGQ